MNMAEKFDYLLEKAEKEQFSQESFSDLNAFLDKYMITSRDVENALGLEEGSLLKEFINTVGISIEKYRIDDNYDYDSVNTESLCEYVKDSILQYAPSEGSMGMLIEEDGTLVGLPVIESVSNKYRYIGENDVNTFISEDIGTICLNAVGYDEPHYEYRGECHGSPAYEKVYDSIEAEVEVTDIEAVLEIEGTASEYTYALPEFISEDENLNKINDYLETKDMSKKLSKAQAFAR